MDPGRTLQHTFCYDPSSKWSLSVSWGYTAQLYPSLITAKDLATAFQTFFTWRSWSEGPFEFNTRLMSDDPCQRPAIYFLDRVHGIGSGQTVTTYKRFWAGTWDDCGRHEYGSGLPVRYVNVTAAELEPDTWKKVRNLFLFQHTSLHQYVYAQNERYFFLSFRLYLEALSCGD